MESLNFPNKSDTTSGAVAEMAGQIGASAQQVVDATKDAGKQISAVGKVEMTTLRSELDNLISRISMMSNLELIAAKEKLLTKIEASKVAAKGAASGVTRQINHGVDITTDYVKERPLQSVAVAGGIGILLGMLISRR